MLFCNALFLLGTYKMHDLQVTNVSVVVGMPMIWVYGIGYIVAVVMGIINLHKLYLLLTGKLRDDQLIQIVEAEGLKEVEAQLGIHPTAQPSGVTSQKA